MTRTLSLLSFAAWVACAVSSASLQAQQYPYKSIRLLVGFQPGGGVDMSARTVGQPLGSALGQSVVVDNRPGAAGNIAAGMVAKSTPDGYTLLMSNSTIASPTLFKNLPFDIRKDLDPVGLIAIGPSVLVVHPAVPARNVKELIALAKAEPKKLAYGSGGIGNVTHLEMEIMNAMVGAQRAVHRRAGERGSAGGVFIHPVGAGPDSGGPNPSAGRLDPEAQQRAARCADH
jgi:tripartite-type tricarboxylate transporter receptor subunit TctC